MKTHPEAWILEYPSFTLTTPFTFWGRVKLSFTTNFNASTSSNPLLRLEPNLVGVIDSALRSFLKTLLSNFSLPTLATVFDDVCRSLSSVFNTLNSKDLTTFINAELTPYSLILSPTSLLLNPDAELSYSSKGVNTLDLKGRIDNANEELSSNFRQQRFQNPIFCYNYKVGNYFSADDKKKLC